MKKKTLQELILTTYGKRDANFTVRVRTHNDIDTDNEVYKLIRESVEDETILGFTEPKFVIAKNTKELLVLGFLCEEDFRMIVEVKRGIEEVQIYIYQGDLDDNEGYDLGGRGCTCGNCDSDELSDSKAKEKAQETSEKANSGLLDKAIELALNSVNCLTESEKERIEIIYTKKANKITAKEGLSFNEDLEDMQEIVSMLIIIDFLLLSTYDEKYPAEGLTHHEVTEMLSRLHTNINGIEDILHVIDVITDGNEGIAEAYMNDIFEFVLN